MKESEKREEKIHGREVKKTKAVGRVRERVGEREIEKETMIE